MNECNVYCNSCEWTLSIVGSIVVFSVLMSINNNNNNNNNKNFWNDLRDQVQDAKLLGHEVAY